MLRVNSFCRRQSLSGVGNLLILSLLVLQPALGEVLPFSTGPHSPFRQPTGLAFDEKGNLLVADVKSHQVFQVSSTGKVSPLVGKGIPGFQGDGGLAHQALLNHPSAIAVNSLGEVFIADTGNHRIRKVNRQGIITTVAGTGKAGYSGDGGPASQAQLKSPGGLAISPEGELYIADTGNCVIRKVDKEGKIWTIAGTGVDGYTEGEALHPRVPLSTPMGITFDLQGRLCFTEMMNQIVRRLEENGRLIPIAGNGHRQFSGDGLPAAQTSLYFPTDLAWDNQGRLYIADMGNHRIRWVDLQGKIHTLAGGPLRGQEGELVSPAALALDPRGWLYVADARTGLLHRFPLPK